MSTFNRTETTVILITPRRINNKHELPYILAADGAAGFHARHFLDGSKVWHGNEICNILWHQLASQLGHDAIETGVYPATPTPKGSLIGRAMRGFLEGNRWVVSGIYDNFSLSENRDLMSAAYALDQASDLCQHRRSLRAIEVRSTGKNWQHADDSAEIKSINLLMRRRFDALEKKLVSAGGRFYARHRKAGRWIYLFQFRQGEPLCQCASVWKGTRHYYLQYDD